MEKGSLFDNEYDSVWDSLNIPLEDTVESVDSFNRWMNDVIQALERRERTCMFTGHRPEKLTIPEDSIQKWLDVKIREAVRQGYTAFISGMQRGVDIWAAESVLKYREQNPSICLIAASAFEGMENNWKEEWKQKYRKILENANEIHYIGRIPGRKSFLVRDHWMVDHSSLVLAVYNDKPGGTKRTIEYAEQSGNTIWRI